MVDTIRQLCFTLEKECGLGNGSVNKWDRSSPSIAKVRAVADALGVSVSYLIGEKEKPIPESRNGMNETTRKIMECVSRMSQQEQEAFLNWLQTSHVHG